MKSWLQDNSIEIHSTYGDKKSVVAENFIKTLKNKTYKYMTLVSKNVYVDKLDDIVNKYSNTYSTIKIKPVDVKSNTYIDFGIENNNKDPEFKVNDHVRISKYKNVFAKAYFPNWSEEVFIIKKVKNTVPYAYVFSDLNSEEIVEMYQEKELQKSNQKDFRVEKVIKRKRNKIYVKWNDYNNSFNRWIDKKILLYKMSYFPVPYTYSKNKIEVELDLANYATRSDSKNATSVGTLQFAKKVDLANLNQILVNQKKCQMV